LSYEGLTTTRLRTLAAWSTEVVFRSDLLHCLINSCRYAVGLPTQPSSQRAMPGHGTSAAKITTCGNGDAPLPGQRDELLNGDRCRNAFPEQLWHPTRLDQLKRSAYSCLPGPHIQHPAQRSQLGIPAAAFDLMPTDVLPAVFIAIRQGGRAGDAEPDRRRRPCQDASGSARLGC